jgi:dimethylhistidine N-methyltransferase
MKTPSRSKPETQRYSFITLRAPRDHLAAEVCAGLTGTPKSLPCKYFYDTAGLALFDRICTLPEYYLMRTETGILEQRASAIIGHCSGPLALVELGSGSSVKTRLLIEPCLARQKQLLYQPIDILPSALEDSARRLVARYPGLKVVGLVGEFSDGLAYLRTTPSEPRLVAFLGSTIGNFTKDENARFLAGLRRALRPEDRFLLGVDLLKDPAILVAAYDDAEGVTARFNLNILARINRDLAADFDLAGFRHRALFNAAESRVEMHLVSHKDQTVRVAALDLNVPFQAGETIQTENCYKHSREAMTALLAGHGFRIIDLFTDPKQWFGLFLIA